MDPKWKEGMKVFVMRIVVAYRLRYYVAVSCHARGIVQHKHWCRMIW